MSGKSSSADEWWRLLEPAVAPSDQLRRPDDPRLGEAVEYWQKGPASFEAGRAVLVGFPQDEGIRRNRGREGAAQAPAAIRESLYRLTPWDGADDVDLSDRPPLDLGNVRISGTLEETQQALADVLAGILRGGGVPIVLGGGHETAFGSYLGYVAVGKAPAIVNLDAHLDVRPFAAGQGHSGSPFRQALEHPTAPLPGTQYVCLGAQPHAVSRRHWLYAREKGCVVRWAAEVAGKLEATFSAELGRLKSFECAVHVSIDADVVRGFEVPGVSAPNALGLPASEVIACARRAGQSPQVAGLELVEVNPLHDEDGRSARWAALVIWNFLVGLALRSLA